MADVIGFYVSGGPAGLDAELLDHPYTGLIGATLRWKRYRSWTAPWLSGHCQLCDAAFTEGGTPGLTSGYSVIGGGPAGQDDCVWICAVCYDLRRDGFCWTVLDTRGEATQPPDLLDAAFRLVTPPVEGDADPGRNVIAIAPLPRSR
jgi:hypothetical protein